MDTEDKCCHTSMSQVDSWVIVVILLSFWYIFTRGSAVILIAFNIIVVHFRVSMFHEISVKAEWMMKLHLPVSRKEKERGGGRRKKEEEEEKRKRRWKEDGQVLQKEEPRDYRVRDQSRTISRMIRFHWTTPYLARNFNYASIITPTSNLLFSSARADPFKWTTETWKCVGYITLTKLSHHESGKTSESAKAVGAFSLSLYGVDFGWWGSSGSSSTTSSTPYKIHIKRTTNSR